MKIRKIINILFLQLFVVLQGVLAQTELDTLQTELNDINIELKELRKQKTIIIRDQNAVQSAENSAINLSLGDKIVISDFHRMVDVLPKSGREYEDMDMHLSRIDLSRRVGYLYTLKAELQRRDSEITRQQEALQRREKEIKRRQKALHGVYAQTSHDTLQRELTMALREIASKKAELQREGSRIKSYKETLQGQEDSANDRLTIGYLSIPQQNDRAEAERLNQIAGTEERLASLRMQQTELDKQAEEIKIQQEKLKVREDLIKIQLEALQKQREAAQSCND